MKIRPYRDGDKRELLTLWTEIFPAESPHNDPQTSLDKKLRTDRDLLLVALIDDRVIGSVMGGYDGHRGWVCSLAVTPSHRRQGIASSLMHAIEEKLKARGCLKVNLQVLSSNAEVVSFYKELGFKIEERISMGKKLY